MQEKSTPSLRLKTIARQPGRSAAPCRAGRSSANTTRDWRSRVVEGLVREQPSAVYLDRACRSTPRYQSRSWWLDTSTTAQSRRAVKRWHGRPQDLWVRNVRISAWVALGAAQAHIGAKYGITRQRVGQIVHEFEWVKKAVQSLADDVGREGGKCQSSLRDWVRSGGLDLESLCVSSGEFRPLSRPNRSRWRKVCDQRGAGSRRRVRRRGLKSWIAGLIRASLESAPGWACPAERKNAPAAVLPLERERTWQAVLRATQLRWSRRGGAPWRQLGLAFMRPVRPLTLEATGKYQAQGKLW